MQSFGYQLAVIERIGESLSEVYVGEEVWRYPTFVQCSPRESSWNTHVLA